MPISGGNHQYISAALEIAGVSIPFYGFSVTLNAFTAASMIDATAPIYPIDGQTAFVPNDFVRMQQNSLDGGLPLTIAAKLSIERLGINSSRPPTHMLQVESGFLDEINPDYAANEQSFAGRTEVGKLIQDQRVAAPIARNLRGDQLISQYFAKYAPSVPLTILAQSSAIAGTTYDDATYTRGIRGLSPWDYIANAAADDGYVLNVHNSAATYGPASYNAPTINLAWGKDLLECKFRSASSRSRNVQVKVYGYNARGQYKLLAKYPTNAVQGAEIYPRFERRQINAATALGIATAYAKDLQTREIVGDLKVVPDADLLKTISDRGANFLVRLDGVLPSCATLYHVKQVVLTVQTSEDEASATATMVIENHAPSTMAQ